jgi:hypothetical protein
MKRLVEIDEGGFEAVFGERIWIWCTIYIYTGRLTAINDDHIELEEPLLIYETGDLAAGDWEDAQSLPSPWRIMKAAIESWGPAKC